MNLNDIHISISGIDYSVNIEFFERLDIVKEELIGDTYFIRSKDDSGFFQISVHKNYYDMIKRDLKIKNILD
jgi:hypothetical protein